MKITKRQLRRLIREQVEASTGGVYSLEIGGPGRGSSDPDVFVFTSAEYGTTAYSFMRDKLARLGDPQSIQGPDAPEDVFPDSGTWGTPEETQQEKAIWQWAEQYM